MKSFNAGTHKQQYEYKSFSPSFLNEMTLNWESEQTIKMLAEANRYLGELNAYSSLVPDVDFFIRMHIVKEATESSRIEGTQTNIEEAIKAKSQIDPEKRDDWQEVQNYIQAMNQSVVNLEKLPLSMRLIKDAHEILLSGVRGHGKTPGKFRKSQNWIGGANLKSASFVPPAHEELPDLLNDLEKFWHRTNVPELIRIAIAHYQFETIHPFLDGNGRTGRLIITLHLVDLGILERPTLYLSDFFEQHRQSYFDALALVRHSNSLDQWIRFFLDGVIYTAQKGKKTFQSIVKLRQEYEKKILIFGKKAETIQKLLHKLYQNPVISPRETEAFLKITPTTANKILQELESMGILKETSGMQRKRSYMLHAYLELFKN